MLTSAAVRIIDICVASVLGIFVIFCFFGIALALSWASQPRPAKILRRFNGLWKERVAVELIGGLWLAWQLTRMLALWGISDQSLATTQSTAKTLCRVYLGIGLGFLQPLFLLTALLLAQHSLGCRRLHLRNLAKPVFWRALDVVAATIMRRKAGDRGCAWSVVPAAFAATLPLAGLQLLVAFFSRIFARHQWEARVGSLPHYFFGVWYRGSAEQCSSDTPGCIVCLFPAASVIVSLGFTVVYLIALWLVTARLAATVINRRLRLRIRAFRYGLDGLAVANLAVMGASVSTNPFNIIWQLLWIFYGLTAAAAVGLVGTILVVLPVLDARSAAKADHTVKWTDVEAGTSARVELSQALHKRELDAGQRGSDSDSEPGDSRRALKAGMRSSSAKTDASSQPLQPDSDPDPAPDV